MSARICIYPGSFDPVTVGHLDLITRAAGLFDEVIVAVLINRGKRGTIPVDKRLALLERSCAGLPNVRVESYDGLLVELARRNGNAVVLRGLRNARDFEAEFDSAGFNARLAPEVETIFLPCSEAHRLVSSSVVRELASFGGDLTGLVPACVQDEITTLLRP